MPVDPSQVLDCGMGLMSCGLLLYRFNSAASSGGPESGDVDTGAGIELLLAHMGGPFWARKDAGAWSIPKGISEDGDLDVLATAEREFGEEMGSPPPPGDSIELGSSRSGKKRIEIFAREGDFDLATFKSNEFEMEWPRGSGQMQSFPEADRAAWVTPEQARTLLAKSQVVFVDRLLETVT